MINSNYDLDQLVINAIARGYQDVRRYNIDDMTIVFTAGNLAAKFYGYSYQLIAVGDCWDSGRIEWYPPEAKENLIQWRVATLDAILEEDVE